MPDVLVEAEAVTRAATARPMQITWLGHATTLIELDGVRLLTDPVLGSRVGPLVRLPAAPSPEASADVDAVLLSHLHADHADLRSLRALGSGTRVIATYGADRWLRAKGIANVEELHVGAWTQVGKVGICATPARHGGRRGLRTRAVPAGFLVFGSASCYFAGDTDLFAGMLWLKGGIDVALLPVGGWGRSLGPGHLDPVRAAVAVAAIAPRYAIPIHWATLVPAWPPALRPDPVLPGARFAQEVARRRDATQVCVLAPGDALTLDPGAPCAAARS